MSSWSNMNTTHILPFYSYVCIELNGGLIPLVEWKTHMILIKMQYLHEKLMSDIR